MSVSQEIVASNQVQFSLAIPLAKYNMCTHFRKPQAITIERSVAASAVFSLPMPTANFKFRGCGESGIEGGSSGVPLTSLSQDRMTAIVQVVKRDLRNRRCQATGAHQDSYNASANKIQISEMSRRSRLPKKVKICAPTKGHQSSKMNKGSIFLQDAANQKAAVITRTHSLSNACFSEGNSFEVFILPLMIWYCSFIELSYDMIVDCSAEKNSAWQELLSTVWPNSKFTVVNLLFGSCKPTTWICFV